MVLPKLTIKRQEWKAEMIGILFLGLAIFFLLALLSYSPLDPSLNHSGGGKPTIANLGGRSGALVADLLLQGAGLGALILPFYLVGIFIGLVSGRKFPPLTSIVGAGFLMLCTAVWSALLVPIWVVQGVEVLSGGVVGQLLGKVLLDFFNPIGTYLLMAIFFALALIVTTHISPLRVAVLIAGSLLAAGRSLLLGGRQLLRFFLALMRRGAGKESADSGDSPEDARKRLKKVKIGQPHNEKKVLPPMRQETLPFLRDKGRITLPGLNLLDDPPPRRKKGTDPDSLRLKSQQLENKLRDYGVIGEVVAVHPGPVVTMYEFQPAAGVKLSRISSLADDLALAMSAMSVRIVAPIPGKAVVGIEIPNLEREDVNFKELLLSSSFQQGKSALPLALGKEIDGVPMVADLAKMPHLLIAGSTGSGKSVGINCLICSILFKLTPEEVKFIMVDPKRLELSVYDHIPHLLLPVVTNPKRAAAALGWAVEEMERRYSLMSLSGTRNISSYNRFVEKQSGQRERPVSPVGAQVKNPSPVENGDVQEEVVHEKLPYIVIIIDELADLMMVASKEVEESITRLAQMARAAGIHLILATQRPSVDVITGLIKANFPARISFRVSSKIDSRTILDASGAEQLLGNGDMLLLSPGSSNFTRLHGAFISDDEIKALSDYLKGQGAPEYQEGMLKKHEAALAAKAKGKNGARSAADLEEMVDEDGYDELYDQAVDFVTRLKGASASMIQRKFRIGYNRAARIIETMEREGIVGPAEGSKPRKVLVAPIE
ncbi:MAG: DNA translocase FtsK 4TM domain-containing protein [Deltaproteobacteria bacterium]|nr:DNA translocase FtsK 4TM domain-containing protein [Deltaproteobacteria bacterium]